MHISTIDTFQEFLQTAAFEIGAVISTRRGDVHIALAGGSTPRPVYHELALKALDGRGVHLYQTDERFVAPDADISNQRMIRQAFAQAPDMALHMIDTTGALEASCETYATVVQDICFDLCVLGIGTDGHIASVFPDSGLQDRPVFPTLAPDGSQRITLHPDLILRSKQILVLLSGPSKEGIVQALHTQKTGLPMSCLYGHPSVQVLFTAASV